MDRCDNPTPPHPKLLQFRKDYGHQALSLMASLAQADCEAHERGDTDDRFSGGLLIIGIRMGAKYSKYMGVHNIDCGCKIPIEARLQMFEQLTPPLRKLCEDAKVKLPSAALDPMKASDFWMHTVDNAEKFAFMTITEMKRTGGALGFKAITMMAEALRQEQLEAPGTEGGCD